MIILRTSIHSFITLYNTSLDSVFLFEAFVIHVSGPKE